MRHAATTRPVVAFLGHFGAGNIGNEASLRSAMVAWRDMAPDVELRCICEVPDRVEFEHGLPSTSIHTKGRLLDLIDRHRVARALLLPLTELARLVKASWTLRGVRALIIPGTGILDDFGLRPWQMPLDLARWAIATKISRTRFLLISIGAGPIRHPLSRFLMLRVAVLADYCSFRDQRSKDFMTALGRRTDHDPVYPDLAFSLSRPTSETHSADGKMTVGIGVIQYLGWNPHDPGGAAIQERYKVKLVEFCSGLIDAGHNLRLLVGDYGDGPTLRELELELRDRVPPGSVARCLEIPTITTFDDLLHAVAGTEVVVASRFHTVVAALMTGRPVLSLGYAPKNDDLLVAAGLDGCGQNIETFDVGRLRNELERVRADRDAVERNLKVLNEQFAEQLRVQYQNVIRAAGVATRPPVGVSSEL